MIKGLFNTISHASMTLPALEVTALIVIMAFCLLLKFTRTGLIIAYLFVYRWGWLFFVEQSTEVLTAYLVFGCLVGVLTVVGMLRSTT